MQPSRGGRKSDAIVWSLPFDQRAAGTALQTWLYDELRKAIITGRLPAGALLPGSRTFAQHYSVSRGTAQSVYDQLSSEGYLETQTGSGTRVTLALPDSRFTVSAPVNAAKTHPVQLPVPQGSWFHRLEQLPSAFPTGSSAKLPFPFMPHRADVKQFPIDIWRKLQTRHLRTSRLETFWEADPSGHPGLRHAIAEKLAIARGLNVQPEHILILGSVQQALDLCLRVMTNSGDQVWMEDPGYVGARRLMQAAGMRVTDVGVDNEGMRVADGIRDAPAARLVYTTPSHQSPLGTTLSNERRYALLDWAAGSGAVIFEDDYDSEYRFAGAPIAGLRGIPGSESHVIFSGTFSKLLFPALRVAFLVLPPHLLHAFTSAASLMWRQANGLAQAVLADFIADGHFDHHVRRMRKIYSERANMFCRAAERHWCGLIEVQKPEAGLDTVGRLLTMSEDQAMARLNAAGVGAFPLGKYAGSIAATPALIMGFATYSEEEIEKAAARVAAALRD